MTSPEPSPHRLRRSGSERRVAGVAGGVAAYFGLDPTLVRIALVVLAFVGGLGLALYAVGAFVMPAEEGAPPLTTTNQVAVGVIAIGALLSFPFAGGSALVLIVPAALGILVWRLFGGTVDPRLVRASVVVVALAGALALGIGAGIAAAFGAGTVIAICVIAAGLALVVGGVRGGTRWLIVPALMLALPATVVQAADLKLEGGVGDREYRPASVSDVRPVYRLGAGELRLDLRDVQPEPGQPLDVAVRIGVGDAEVVVPRDACVQVTASAGVGETDLFGQRNDGIDVEGEQGGIPAAGQPVFRLRMRAGVGELRVRTPGWSAGTGCEG